ncbi:MAG: ATP-binding protein, partial [Planctomyces sp.]
ITTNRPFRDWGRIFDVDNTLATAMIDRLMLHGEAMVIQGSSFRTKGETSDEKSVPRHHFAQTALAASVRAVRRLPETLLEHQTTTSAFPFASSRLRVRPTACKPPSSQRQSAGSQLQRADLGLES